MRRNVGVFGLFLGVSGLLTAVLWLRRGNRRNAVLGEVQKAASSLQQRANEWDRRQGPELRKVK